jgi:hypothetical protein
MRLRSLVVKPIKVSKALARRSSTRWSRPIPDVVSPQQKFDNANQSVLLKNFCAIFSRSRKSCHQHAHSLGTAALLRRFVLRVREDSGLEMLLSRATQSAIVRAGPAASSGSAPVSIAPDRRSLVPSALIRFCSKTLSLGELTPFHIKPYQIGRGLGWSF